MYEVKVLSAFIQSREEYESAKDYIKATDLSPIGSAVLKSVGDYYEADEQARAVDTEVLASRLERKFGSVPKHKQELKDYLTELFTVETSAVNVGEELLEAEKERRALSLADALLRKDKKLIPTLLAEFNEIIVAESLDNTETEAYKGVALAELAHIYDTSALIRVAPPALNERLRGGMIRGQFLILAAMPETGKSLLLLNMCSGFIQQGLRTLYVGNEDPMEELVLRLLSNLSGVRTDELFANQQVVMERALERGYELVTFQGLDPGSIEEIDALLRKDEYDVLIIDQLRNLTSRSENNTQRLEQVAQGARNLARRHNILVVAATQAAESARDKLVLNSGDIDGSNIGIPGACDVIAMVGVNDDYYLRDLRKITLVKNKRGGRHDNFTVHIDRWKSRVKNFGGVT